MQKGKRYKANDGMDYTVESVTAQWVDLTRQGAGAVVTWSVTPEKIKEYLHNGTLVELPDDDHSQDAARYLSNEVYGKWIIAPEPVRCNHTNPDGSEAWVNQGFMHVLMACKFCGDKKP